MPARMTYLAIDYGKSKTGLAVEVNNIAIPLKIVETETLLSVLSALIAERNVSAVVVGMAHHMDGTVSPQMHRTHSFLSVFKKRFPQVAVIQWDERLTTFEARDSLGREGVKNAKKTPVDDISASIILQNFLDTAANAQNAFEKNRFSV